MMHSYGSDDEDYDTFSMGSDDMEKFGLSNDDEVVEGEYETYEIKHMAQNEDAINHKELISRRECLQYFEDYCDIEEQA